MIPNGFSTLLLFIFLFMNTTQTEIENDFRHISYQDLQQSVKRFNPPGINAYSQVYFDVARSQLIVGAKNSLYRLQLTTLHIIEHIFWNSSNNVREECITKGETEENCQNYIKVLLSDGKQIFACGTNAFKPTCTWREFENISNVTKWVVDGNVKCSHSPLANMTAIISEKGDYYFGGPTDFSGSRLLISKSVENNPPSLLTSQYDSFTLNEPQFVGTFETDKFIYFLFREAAVEYINCGKIVYSRIGRVCKEDDNGYTFIKARLNCSISGDYPFYFNEIQSVSYVSSQSTIYATFTTSPNSIAGSAICAFNLTSINEAFSGPFKYQDNSESIWNKHNIQNGDQFECKTRSIDTKNTKYKLMDSAVKSSSLNPLYTSQLERFTHITVDVLKNKLHNSVSAIYVATLEGLIKKITLHSNSGETCLVEIWQTTPTIHKSIRQMQFLKETNSVYITSDDSLMQISAAHCNRHTSKESCINSMDPYCGWSELEEKCTPPPNANYLDSNWLQDASTCPILNAPVDGGWSAWSEWETCKHYDKNDKCLCQMRQCNNPKPANNGRSCVGPSILVTNCTVHGGWSEWSSWSACTATCGTALKTRSRTCSNPAPAFGGRVCVGQDRTEALCIENPPCPAPPQDGNWGPWNEWSKCFGGCSDGYKMRQRHCNNPPPKNGGHPCTGNSMEYGNCTNVNCADLKATRTTEWQTDYNVSRNRYYQKRFKMYCKAPVRFSSQIKLTIKEEHQICVNGNCQYTRDTDYETWNNWSNWSECSVSCGGGTQMRTRTCNGKHCKGPTDQVRDCNKNSCERDEWGCWSEWSPCNVSCGWGVKTRTRKCLFETCSGEDREEEPCEEKPCTAVIGWGPWTKWSLCDENNLQYRKRKCSRNNPGPQICQGSNNETRLCLNNQNEVLPVQTFVKEESSCQLESISSFIVGLLIPIIVFCSHKAYKYYVKRKNRIPSSPHYINAEQNPYITVPTREKPAKRSNSTCSSRIFSNGTLKSPLKPIDDFEITTLKRHSNEIKMNGHLKQQRDNSYYD